MAYHVHVSRRSDSTRVVDLVPQQIRNFRLPPPRRRKHGFDAESVRRLLDRIADQIDAQRAYTDSVLEENRRIKDALAEWQSQQSKLQILRAQDYSRESWYHEQTQECPTMSPTPYQR